MPVVKICKSRFLIQDTFGKKEEKKIQFVSDTPQQQSSCQRQNSLLKVGKVVEDRKSKLHHKSLVLIARAVLLMSELGMERASENVTSINTQESTMRSETVTSEMPTATNAEGDGKCVGGGGKKTVLKHVRFGIFH